MKNKLQKAINRVRAKYGDDAVEVHHMEPDGGFDGETTISVNMNVVDNPFILDMEVNEIVGGCDSGCGFGYRDLQLCKYFPELK